MRLIPPSPGLVARGSKALVTAGVAFLLTLIVSGNVVEYEVNFAIITKVLRMEGLDPGANVRHRAIESPVLQHGLYVVIIALEAIAALLCWLGAYRMARRWSAPESDFAAARAAAMAGLTLAYLVLQVAIFAVGNEWFAMWRSAGPSMVESVFRTLMIFLGALIYVSQPARRA